VDGRVSSSSEFGLYGAIGGHWPSIAGRVGAWGAISTTSCNPNQAAVGYSAGCQGIQLEEGDVSFQDSVHSESSGFCATVAGRGSGADNHTCNGALQHGINASQPFANWLHGQYPGDARKSWKWWVERGWQLAIGYALSIGILHSPSARSVFAEEVRPRLG
jgi:hypothetical protein